MEPPVPAGSVAVVFVHGMGEPRRYADSARLATALADHAKAAHPTVDVRWDEVPAGPADRRPRAQAEIRAVLGGVTVIFRDVYWAPLVAGRTHFRSLVSWLRSRAVLPLRYLLAPWASHAQLKIDVLHEDRVALSPDQLALLVAYERFVDRTAGRSFDDFIAFVTPRGPAIVAAAHAWRARFTRAMGLTLWRALPLLAALLTGVVAVPMTAAWLASRIVAPPPGAGAALATGAIAVLWLLAFPLARLLVRTLGDVEVYATYTEASERHEAHEACVAQGTAVLRRALADPAIGRVVLVGHSLGSVVAWDALRSLALEARARAGSPDAPRIDKLSRVITFGSPVDKIRFFHFADDRADATFRRVLETLRVDTAGPPFDGRPGGLAWDNYFDPADLVAGRLESPNDRAMTAPVRNVAVANGAFPNPFSTHLDYLRNDRVLDGLLAAIAGEARPTPSPAGVHRARAWVTAAELLLPAAVLAVFFFRELLPLVFRAAQGDPLGWGALAILLATLFFFA
ncbi:MAG: hypothetical protein ABIP29_01940 [Candidatus Eisenbacteria bacterium]